MKAIFWQGPERMEIGERPEPPGPDGPASEGAVVSAPQLVTQARG